MLVVDTSRESVGDGERRRRDHCHAGLTLELDVFDVDVELSGLVLPAGLARRPERRKRLRHSDLWSVITVELGAVDWLEVKRAPGFEDADDHNGEEIQFVGGGVAGLGGLHLLGEVGDGLHAFALVLHEHGTESESGGVGVDDERKLQVGVGEDQHGVLKAKS